MLYPVGVLIDHLDLSTGLAGVYGDGVVGAGAGLAGARSVVVPVHPDGGGAAKAVTDSAEAASRPMARSRGANLE